MAERFIGLDGSMQHGDVPPPKPPKSPIMTFLTGPGSNDADGHYATPDGKVYRDLATYQREQNKAGNKREGRFNWFDAPDYDTYKRRHRRYSIIMSVAAYVVGAVLAHFVLGLAPEDGVFGLFLAAVVWVTYFIYTVPVGRAYYFHSAQRAQLLMAAIPAATVAYGVHRSHAQQQQQAAWQAAQQPTPEQIAQQQSQAITQAIQNAQQPGWVPRWDD